MFIKCFSTEHDRAEGSLHSTNCDLVVLLNQSIDVLYEVPIVVEEEGNLLAKVKEGYRQVCTGISSELRTNRMFF